MKKKAELRGVFMLLLTALIWGSSFVAQSVGMESVRAFTFNGIRTLLGAAVLLPFILVRDKITGRSMTVEELEARKKSDRKMFKYGLILGIVFCVASNLQQVAFYTSTAGKIAFVTAIYMFFVPIIGLFIGKRVSLVTWICVFAGFVGLYFLCIDPANLGGVSAGDLFALGCAFFYAIHILLVEKFAPDVDGIKLSCMQFVISGCISVVIMFLFENPQAVAIKSAVTAILYSGIMSCGVAYTFQIIGQKYTEATIASLLMCMESVFAVLAAAVILGDRLSGREIAGCVIMFAAIILSQVAEMKKNAE